MATCHNKLHEQQEKRPGSSVLLHIIFRHIPVRKWHRHLQIGSRRRLKILPIKGREWKFSPVSVSLIMVIKNSVRYCLLNTVNSFHLIPRHSLLNNERQEHTYPEAMRPKKFQTLTSATNAPMLLEPRDSAICTIETTRVSSNDPEETTALHQNRAIPVAVTFCDTLWHFTLPAPGCWWQWDRFRCRSPLQKIAACKRPSPSAYILYKTLHKTALYLILSWYSYSCRESFNRGPSFLSAILSSSRSE